MIGCEYLVIALLQCTSYTYMQMFVPRYYSETTIACSATSHYSRSCQAAKLSRVWVPSTISWTLQVVLLRRSGAAQIFSQGCLTCLGSACSVAKLLPTVTKLGLFSSPISHLAQTTAVQGSRLWGFCSGSKDWRFRKFLVRSQWWYALSTLMVPSKKSIMHSKV